MSLFNAWTSYPKRSRRPRPLTAFEVGVLVGWLAGVIGVGAPVLAYAMGWWG